MTSYQHYSKEYRDSIVELARAGTPVAQLAREHEPSAATIHKWLRANDEPRRPIESSDEENRRLKRQNRDLREENAILKKAAAWFALDVVKTGGRSSRS